MTSATTTTLSPAELATNVCHHGDVLDVLPTLPAGCVQTVVTSPPYWGLRDYGVPGQLGLEATPEKYVARMVQVFREVRRVLRDDGTAWVNLGDSYNAYNGNRGESTGFSDGAAGRGHPEHERGLTAPGLKPKDLCGIPWRVALALQSDGWVLRQDIVWSKPNPMPESVADRCTRAHEYVFLLSKRGRYFFDADAIREPHAEPWRSRPESEYQESHGPKDKIHAAAAMMGTVMHREYNPRGRNRRSVWTIASEAYPEAHFATFPRKLVEPCILAGTSQHGACAACGSPWERVVEREFQTQSDVSLERGIKGAPGQKPMDASSGWDGVPRGNTVTKTLGWRPTCACGTDEVRPCVVGDFFLGSGTTAQVAQDLGRRWIGVELSAEYIELQAARTAQMGLEL